MGGDLHHQLGGANDRGVRIRLNLIVDQRIDIRFHARIESTMRNEWLDDIQVISKIWYQHPDHPPLREIEVEPVNEAE